MRVHGRPPKWSLSEILARFEEIVTAALEHERYRF